LVSLPTPEELIFQGDSCCDLEVVMVKNWSALLIILLLMLSACEAPDAVPLETPPLEELMPSLNNTPTPQTPTEATQEVTPGATLEIDPTPATPPANTPTQERTLTVQVPQVDPHRASQLLNLEIRDEQETWLGLASDIIVDLDSQHLAYVLLSENQSDSDGSVSPIPFLMLSIDLSPENEYVFYLDAPVERLQNAPQINLEATQLHEPGWEIEIQEYWSDFLTEASLSVTETPTAGPTPAMSTPTPPNLRNNYILLTQLLETSVNETSSAVPTPTDSGTEFFGGAGPVENTPEPEPENNQPTSPYPPPPSPTPASGTPIPDTGTPFALTPTPATPTPGAQNTEPAPLGEEETNNDSQETPGAATSTAGERIASLEDLIINPQTGEILYVIIETLSDPQDKFWKPVPLEAFTRFQILVMGIQSRIAAEIDPSRLTQAPGFEPESIPDLSDNLWDTGIRSYWQLD
jgi:sporulation protein YlmC with PRC-barrel domain